MGDFYKMHFSYFQNGIKDTTPLKTISIDQLVELIKNNPKKDIISTIHSLRSISDSHYQILKEKLPKILETKGPSLIEVICPFKQDIVPSSSTKQNEEGKLVSQPLENMFPFLSENEFKQEMIIKPIL
jgi:pyruvate/2-oxoacid:ferredoxin oxidoreductase beta subunit